MESFEYQALDDDGRDVSGTVQADTARQARALIRAQGLLPSRVQRVQAREHARQLWAKGLPASELSLVTRQMATLLESGLTIELSLNALIESSSEPLTRQILSGVRTEVTAGLSLARALGAYEKSFPDFYRALVHGGEESGALPTVLQHLADYLDARQALRQKTALALLYPALVTVVAFAIVTGLLMYVVPQVVEVFRESRQQLPVLTRSLIALSDFLRSAWPYLLAAAVAVAFGFRIAMRNEGTRRTWHGAILRLPWLGAVIRSVNTSRFASTLAILIGGGVPLLTAFKSGEQVVTNLAIRVAIERAGSRLREGATLSRALKEGREFPPLLIHLVGSGEISGKLERMLNRYSQLENQFLERRLTAFLTILEPVMILLMGVVVLLIVLAILLPIIEVNQLVR
jgi:general secretion pathway protein F